MNSLISRKTQKQMSVSWFPAAKFVPLKGTPTWRLHTKPYKVCRVKRFSEYLAYELSYRPDSWRGYMYIYQTYLLSFPWFWTFCIDWLAFLFLMALQWKHRRSLGLHTWGKLKIDFHLRQSWKYTQTSNKLITSTQNILSLKHSARVVAFDAAQKTFWGLITTEPY